MAAEKQKDMFFFASVFLAFLAVLFYLFLKNRTKETRDASKLDETTRTTISYSNNGEKKQETRTKIGPTKHFLEISGTKMKNSHPRQTGSGIRQLKITNSELEDSSPIQEANHVDEEKLA